MIKWEHQNMFVDFTYVTSITDGNGCYLPSIVSCCGQRWGLIFGTLRAQLIGVLLSIMINDYHHMFLPWMLILVFCMDQEVPGFF
jgi:hypothetical protein